MADTDKAVATILRNVEEKTGKTLADFSRIIAASKLTRHGEIRSMLMEQYDLGYGQANTVVHLARKSDGQSAADAAGLSADEVLAGIYAGKEELRPLHDKVLATIAALGSFEAAPKKGYVSYRRKKQFAMVGPKTRNAVEIGLSAKSLPADPRLKEMPPASMCRYTTRVSSPGEIDAALKRWLKTSFDEAG